MCILLISRTFWNKQTIYTVRHLCRITLLVKRVTSQLAEVYVNVNIRHLTIFKRHIVTLWQSLVVDYHFSPVPVSFLSRECWFPQLSERQCSAFVLITFSCGPLLYANCHLKPKRQLRQHQSLWIFQIYFSVLRSWAFPEGHAKNYWSVSRPHLQNPTPCWWAQQVYLRATWASIEVDHIGRRPYPSPSDGGGLGYVFKVFSASRIRGEVIMRPERSLFVRMAQGCLVATGYRSRHPKLCSRLNPDHHRRCSNLAPESQPSA